MLSLFALMLAALMLAAPMPEPAAPLPALGKWSVAYHESSCTLSRSFGDAAAPVKLDFTPAALGGRMAILFAAPAGKGRQHREGAATLLLLPGNRTLTTSYQSLEQRDKGQHVVVMNLDGEATGGWQDVEALAIALDKAPPVTIALQGMAAGVRALQQCHDDLLRGWEVDPAELTRVVVKPKLMTDLGEIYSTEVLREGVLRGAPSRIMMIFKVDSEGWVRKCRVVASSGIAMLNAGTCALATTKLRYEPARDKDGQPTASHILLAVRWPVQN